MSKNDSLSAVGSYARSLFDCGKGMSRLADELFRAERERTEKIAKQMSRAECMMLGKLGKELASPASAFGSLMGGMKSKLDIMERMIPRCGMLDSVHAANLSISRMFSKECSQPRSVLPSMAFDTGKMPREIFEKVHKTTCIWEKADVNLGMTAAGLSLKSEVSKLAAVSIGAEIGISRIKWDRLGDAIGISESNRTLSQETFRKLADSYAGVYRSFQMSARSIPSMRQVSLRMPPVELFSHVNLVGSVSTQLGESEESLGLRTEIARGLGHESEGALQELLGHLDPALLPLWRGATEALESDNPDRVRHVTVSLRELFTQVLHKLAPDDAIREWASDSRYYHNGNPTRKARILHIYRRIKDGPLEDFAEKDIEAALELVQLFEAGTHRVRPEFSDKQARAIVLRMNNLIRFMLEVSQD